MHDDGSIRLLTRKSAVRLPFDKLTKRPPSLSRCAERPVETHRPEPVGGFDGELSRTEPAEPVEGQPNGDFSVSVAGFNPAFFKFAIALVG